MKLNSRGFSAIEGLLIFLAVAIIGGTGYYVYHSKQVADKNLADSSSSANFAKPKKVTNFDECKAAKGSKLLETYPQQCVTKDGKKFTADPTSGWKAYTSPQGGFALKYPSSWFQPSNPSACGDILETTLLLGPTANSVAKCGTDSLGQINVASASGSQTGAYGGETFTKTSSQDITVDGVKGQRITGYTNADANALGAYPKGTKQIVYIFSSNGKTITATYIQTPTGNYSNDVSADFDLMVKSLNFK